MPSARSHRWISKSATASSQNLIPQQIGPSARSSPMFGISLLLALAGLAEAFPASSLALASPQAKTSTTLQSTPPSARASLVLATAAMEATALGGSSKNTGVVTGGDYPDIHIGKACIAYSLAPCAHYVPATEKCLACSSSEYPSPWCFTCESENVWTLTLTNSMHPPLTACVVRTRS